MCLMDIEVEEVLTAVERRLAAEPALAAEHARAEALRQLIAAGKTVLFISHDIWNVRRLCSDIVWMDEGRVRAYGPAAEIAERYMNEVNIEALANQANALQSHRGGTGEIRYASVDLVDAAGRPVSVIAAGDTLTVRARYRAEQRVRGPVFQIAIVDVDTGLVITTATSSSLESPDEAWGAGVVECRFSRLPLRPRQYVLRLSITDSHQLVSYDVVSAGPRFAVSGASGEQAADAEDGFVSLPYEFVHRGAMSVAQGTSP
jgi:hypothetical protein